MLLESWIEAYNVQFPIYPDGSHNYNNLELERAGFEVHPIHFVQWKDHGIGNVRKYLVNDRLEIPTRFKLFISQLKRYQRGAQGRPRKRDDHGPDSALCGLLRFDFMDGGA